MRLWRRAQRLLCPVCSSPFLWAQVGLTRKRNHVPVITSIHGQLICAACNEPIDYFQFLTSSK
jgi:hypothetical protein